MGKMLQIRVDETLKDILERVRREVAEELKKKYKLQSVTIHGTLASQIVAAKMTGNTNLKFEIDKTGLNSGILRLTK